VDFAEKFDGITWKVYVRVMNRFRKTGSYFKSFDLDGYVRPVS